MTAATRAAERTFVGTVDSAPPASTIHLITCEYPPQLGGVSDFTRTIAERLAQSGRAVHVWAPGLAGTVIESCGVVVHRECGEFRSQDLRRIGLLLDADAPPRTLFLQWVPHGFGARAMNVRLCLWLRNRVLQDGDRLDVMVHEPFLPLRGSSLRAKIAGVVQRAMMASLLRAATVIWVSTTSWSSRLRVFARPHAQFFRLPVPNAFPVDRDVSQVARVRAEVLGSATTVVGHIGTYGTATFSLLADALTRIATARTQAAFLLLGRGSEAAKERLEREYPVLAGRLSASGVLSGEAMSHHLQACDVMIQPYPDGASCRRTSLMAALAHGLATVTTTGELTESIWAELDAVELVAAFDPETFADRACTLIDNPARRAILGRLAASMYNDHFSADRAMQLLATRLDPVPA